MKLMKTIIVILIITSLFCCKKEKPIKKTEYSLIEINSENLKRITHTLAHDSMEGRGAGYIGELRASKFIANNFKDIGLEPIRHNKNDIEDYFQPFNFYTLGDSKPWQEMTSQNVAAILKGSDLPDEYIIVGGHHDGQGTENQADLGKSIAEGMPTDREEAKMDTIWNSAVDNAVSIAAIIEIARFIKINNLKLKRSIIFAGFSAEESSLDGSTYFANNPPINFDKIKAMINLEKIVGDPEAEFLYVSFSTNPIFEKIRKKTDSLGDIKMNPFYPGIIANTDHYPFLMREIPAVTIGTGSQVNVHTSLDHAGRLDYKLLKKRTDYILNYIIDLANCDNSSFEFSGHLNNLTGVAGGPATNEEMISQGFEKERAFKVANVVKNSIGDKVGILPEDLIISVNGNLVKKKPFYQGLEDAIDLENIEEEFAVLDILRKGVKVEVKLKIKS